MGSRSARNILLLAAGKPRSLEGKSAGGDLQRESFKKDFR